MRRKRTQRVRSWTRRYRLLLMIVAVIVFIYSAIRIGVYVVRTAQTKRDNQQLAAEYESSQTDEIANEVGETSQEDPAVSGDELNIQGESDADTQAESNATDDLISDLQEEQLSYHVVTDSVLQETHEMHKKNSDFVAWLKIPDVVSCPVVFRDNVYYLDHDFYGKKNSNGALFLDEITPFAEDTSVLLIHGHNMHNGEMFGNVSHYTSKTFAKENVWMKLSTLYDTEYYVLVGAMKCDLADALAPAYYSCAIYTSAPELDFEYFNQLWNTCSLYRSGIDFDEHDALVTLSTCLEGDERLLVLFRKVRKNENMEDLAAMMGGI